MMLMKYRLLFLSLVLLFPVLLWGVPEQRNPVASPRFAERLTGRANLSDGIYWNGDEKSGMIQSLTDFFSERGIPMNAGNRPSRKNIVLEVRQVTSIPAIPADAFHGYSIHISPSQITIRYLTPQAEILAGRQLMRLIREQGPIRKKVYLPCYEIRDWMTAEELTAFRWNGPQSVIPLNATIVEMMLTDPTLGWAGAGNVLQAVGYEQSLYPGADITYADIEMERKKLESRGLEVLPVFDLTDENVRFEEVTGHPMLSVEGMRFIQLLLDAYFSASGTTSVAFIVPAGRYRDQIREIVSRYPNITDLTFLEE